MFFSKKKIIIIYICKYTIINIMKDYILKCGLTIAVIQAFMLLSSYLIGIEFMLSSWWNISQSLITLILIITLAIQYRKFKKNILSFKDAFTFIFFTYSSSGFVFALFSFIFYNFIIDFESINLMKEIQKEKVIEMFEWMRDYIPVTDSQIDDALIEIDNPNYSAKNFLTSWFFSLPFLYILPSLIISAFIKKKSVEDIADS